MKLTHEEEAEIIDELARALMRLAKQTCLDMVPLYLAGSRLARRDVAQNLGGELEFRPSKQYLALSRGTQNRYRQLACWRHAVLWKAQALVLDADFRDAMNAVYFTPCVSEPPYAWSRAASAAPGADRFPSAATLRDWAKEGCWQSIRSLRSVVRNTPPTSLRAELEAGLVRVGCRDTLRDVLKLDAHFDAWEPM